MFDYRYKSFIELGKELNYTTTAKKLFLTQPTITKHIQSLEKELQVKLFEYQNKNLVLTDMGKYLYKELSLLQNQIDYIKSTINSSIKQKSLTIGASHAIGGYFLGQHTQFFNQSDLNYDLIIENPIILFDKLNSGDIDCALISDNLIDKPTLVKKKFFQDDIVLACSVTNELACNTISFDQLENLPLIFREKESGIYNSVIRQLSSHQIFVDNLKKVRYIGNIEVAKNLLKNENLFAFFYKVTIENDPGLAEITLENVRLKQDYFLVYKKNHLKQESIDYLFSLLENNSYCKKA